MSNEEQIQPTKPFAAFEWMLAGRYLRTRRREGFVSVIALFSFLGIMLGVAVLITVISLLNGFRHDLQDRLLGNSGNIFLSAMDSPLKDYVEVSDKIGKISGVQLVLPMVEGQASVSSPYGYGGAMIRGVRGSDILKIKSVADTLQSGTLENFENSGGVAIGARLAHNLALQVGDQITLMTPKGAATPFGTAPRIKGYQVVAIFELGLADLDASSVYMPIQEAQSFFDRDNDVSIINVFLDDADKTEATIRQIDEVAGRPLLVNDWRQRYRTFFGALQVQRKLAFIVVGLVVLVAALNIISGMIMLVKDKSSDIAILRTMGATRGAIMRVFLMTGASIGVAGTIAGSILGLLIAFNAEAIQGFIERLTNTNLFPPEVYLLDHLSSRVVAGDVLLVVLMALTLSLLATLYPSWQAARLDPVQALRYG
ncbi:lipoprotein-releasing ABC transporter permease subunit [Microvirga sp. W0021]|uniref:Lipoprotein-releasing ABC transporter permease subunit n=1 Tax=Hohaiivirga grylli TaxID=3133970 RepID=A0ABV0BKR2_9HYPH